MDRKNGLDEGARPPRRGAVTTRERAEPWGEGAPNTAVLELRGPALHRLDDVQRQVDALLETGPRVLVVDMSGARHPSSSTIAALMCVRRRASERGVGVVLRAADRRLIDTLRRSGLLGTLAIEPPARERRRVASGRDPDGGTPQAGVTRLDLVCGPQVAQTAQDLTHRWAQDRALSATARNRLASLVTAAITHGLRFDPRSVTITMRWLDPDRVRVEVRWKGSSGTARTCASAGDLESTAGTLDAFAEEWGFGSSGWGPVQWMVLDTR